MPSRQPKLCTVRASTLELIELQKSCSPWQSTWVWPHFQKGFPRHVTQLSLGSPSPSHSWLQTPVGKKSPSRRVWSSSPCHLVTEAIRRTTRLHKCCTAHAGGKHWLVSPPCPYLLFEQTAQSMTVMSYELFFPRAQTVLKLLPRHVHVVQHTAPEHCFPPVPGSTAALCWASAENPVSKYLERDCFTVNAFTYLGSIWKERFSAK